MPPREMRVEDQGPQPARPGARRIREGRVASFTIANTARVYNKQTGQYEDGAALFMRCSAWNDLAQHCAQSLAKGMRVIAQGRLKQHSYQAQDGTNRTVVELQTRAAPSTAIPPRRRRPSTPAQAAGAKGRNSRRRHSNPPRRRPMIRGARRRPTNHHSETSARQRTNRNFKD